MSTLDLNADCASCMALCCVAFELQRCESFALDKPAGTPCPNLRDNRCGIHARLVERGFAGCAQFDCHGAGQRAGNDTALFFTLLEYHRLLWALSFFPQLRHVSEALEAECRDVSHVEPLSEARRAHVRGLLQRAFAQKATAPLPARRAD